MIEDNCVVSAAQIGNYVHLGADSIIGRRAVIKGFGLWNFVKFSNMIPISKSLQQIIQEKTVLYCYQILYYHQIA